MISPKVNADDIEKKVNEYISHNDFLHHLGARVLAGTARQETWGWTVVVGTENLPPKTYEYVAELSEISDALHEKERLDVLIAPSGVRPSDTGR